MRNNMGFELPQYGQDFDSAPPSPRPEAWYQMPSSSKNFQNPPQNQYNEQPGNLRPAYVTGYSKNPQQWSQNSEPGRAPPSPRNENNGYSNAIQNPYEFPAASYVVEEDDTWWYKFRLFMTNDGGNVAIMILWFIGNFLVIGNEFYFFIYGAGRPRFDLIGFSLPFARGFAGSIKLCSGLILFPVMRNFLSYIRGTFINDFIPLDSNIVFHRINAWTIAMATAIHTSAHLFNVLFLNRLDLVTLRDAFNFGNKPDLWIFVFFSVPGSTGILLIVVMLFMYTTAVSVMRRKYFELFWYLHHLFILYYLLILIHGLAALFATPATHYFVMVPFAMYLLERTIRVWKNKSLTMLHMVVQHPSNVIEVRMKKVGFNFKSGQYMFVNCPYIAWQEWHPFTITAAPQDDYTSVHIRVVGNWTGKLKKLLNPDNKTGIVCQNLYFSPSGSPILRVDGPFGAASEEYLNYKYVILVGAGIGVTPFASILKNYKYTIRAQLNGQKGNISQNKVYFFWINRDKKAFEWFSFLLREIESDNPGNFIEIHSYLTGNLNQEDVKTITDTEAEGKSDALTGLNKFKTNFGRPKWDEIFATIGARHPNSKVGVFFCGPKVLSNVLAAKCKKFTVSNTSGSKFVFNKENF